MHLYDVLSGSMVPFYDLSIGMVSPRYMVAPLYKLSVGLSYLGTS